jgi:hypothetical protein
MWEMAIFTALQIILQDSFGVMEFIIKNHSTIYGWKLNLGSTYCSMFIYIILLHNTWTHRPKEMVHTTDRQTPCQSCNIHSAANFNFMGILLSDYGSPPSESHCTWCYTRSEASTMVNVSGLRGLEVTFPPHDPSDAGSNPTEVVQFLRTEKFRERVLREGL